MLESLGHFLPEPTAVRYQGDMTDRDLLGIVRTGALRAVLLTALGAACVAACGGGGPSDTADGSGGSTTGSGGTTTSTGGTVSGAGGNTSNTGGTTGNSGGAASGGATNAGGEGGFGGDGPGPGAGGSEGNDPDCPEALPGPEDECEGGFNSPTCTYGDQECECGGGMNATWECTEAGEEEECPAEAPEDGATCTAQQFCNFGGGDFCICDGEEWNCP